MEKPEVLFDKYQKRIYNLALRMTGSRDDARDITQETFIQAFSSVNKFKGESHVYTWLYRIAKNICLKFLEKKNKTTFISIQNLIEKAGSPVSEEINEEEKQKYISQVKDGCLTGLLRCLSIQQRLVFILYVLLDIPINQVAEVMGKSENATRILAHRSKQNIKEFLCNNCSLYDYKNKCRCENLINFSLRQGWISSFSDKSVKVEAEIKNIKSVIGLYKTLEEKTPDFDFKDKIWQIMEENKDFLIFNGKKVK